MDNEEAREISRAYADVAEYYPAMKLSGETAALMNFIGVLGMSYGSRVMLYRMRRKEERKSSPKEPPQSSKPAPIHTTPVPENSFGPAPETKPPVTQEMRTGEIAGVGHIEFPPDHPLMGGRRH